MTTTTDTKANRLVVLRALQYLKVLKRRRTEYREDVDAWYRSGDGRSPKWITELDDDGNVHHWNAGGRGYTYPVCIHGRSLWVDYDIPCGTCEESLTVYEEALHLAWRDYHESSRRSKLVAALWHENTAPREALKALGDWVIKPLTEEV